ncbi:cupin domain-containing protein [Microbispora sp. GKU 823]|uniref:cupin domain-containing protein n=1 Tax=Microbispora sp. GKU 823 TaxID=1652100 RepID=UPI0009A2B010|nr:cupin domain-containing protein [Microbispora sp. GKU 823]OPG14273.1 cupin [Microbispora sp. GKU 823]
MTSIVVPDASTAVLGPAAPKPTSVEGDQREATLAVWTSEDGRTSAGVWECTPGRFTAVRDGYHEICQILSGRVTVVSADGTEQAAGPGSTLVMPAGWRGEWHVHETVRKTYVTTRL